MEWLVLALRHLFGFTQNEFANILGVSTKTISRWESGSEETQAHPQNRKAIEALRTIAESLGDLFEPDTIKVWVDRTNPALGGHDEYSAIFLGEVAWTFSCWAVMTFNSAALHALVPVPISGEYFRLIRTKFASQPLSMFGAQKNGRRYNVAGLFGALYLGFDPATCFEPLSAPPFGTVRCRLSVDNGADVPTYKTRTM